MKILIINPNTNDSMSKTIDEAAQNCKDPRTEIVTQTNTVGPLSIEGFFDEILSTPSILEIMIREENNYDAFIIACYSNHPAVVAGKELLKKPVVGIFESSILLANLIGSSFAIVTTSLRWESLLKEGVRQIGFESHCAAVKSSGLAVLDLERKTNEEVEAILFEVSKQAILNHSAETICLGCAGMAGLAEKLEKELKVPVIDPVCAAVKLTEALIYQNLSTAKTGAYQPIESRETTGLSEILTRVYK